MTPYMKIVAPSPSASTAPATARKPGALRRPFQAWRKSSMKGIGDAPSDRGGELMRHHAARRVFEQDAAVEELDAALGEIRVTRIVRHHHDGRAFGMQAAQQIHHGFAVP